MGLCSSNSYDDLPPLPQVKPSNNKLRVVLQPLSLNKLYNQRVSPATFYAKNHLATSFQLSDLQNLQQDDTKPSDKTVDSLSDVGAELSRKSDKDWKNRKTFTTVSTTSDSDKEEGDNLSLSAKSAGTDIFN